MMTNLKALAKAAQEGSEEATQSLLFSFGLKPDGSLSGFLGKYESLLLYGKINLKDKDTRRFLQLYIKDPVIRVKLVNRYHDYVGALAGQEVATYLQNKVSRIPKEDIRQQLVLEFVELINRYTESKVPFEGYIYNTYRFRVYEYLRKHVFKYEWFHHPNLTLLEEEVLDESATISPSDAWTDRFYATELNRGELGIFWINGRCDPVFDDLTIFERTILRDRYLHKETDGEIAQKYGYHINTIYKNRHKAIEKLDDTIKREGR